MVIISGLLSSTFCRAATNPPDRDHDNGFHLRVVRQGGNLAQTGFDLSGKVFQQGCLDDIRIFLPSCLRPGTHLRW